MVNKKINLRFVVFIGFFLTILIIGQPPDLFCQAEDDDSTENFVYSVQNRRDPFVSLLDSSGEMKAASIDKHQKMMNAVAAVKVAGIVWDKEMPLAMINKGIKKLGDNVNGLVIKKITPESVIFGYSDLTYTVTIVEKKDF